MNQQEKDRVKALRAKVNKTADEDAELTALEEREQAENNK